MDNFKKRLCVVDINDKIVDTVTALSGHQRKTLVLHRAFSVFIFNSKNELLVQKRSMDKLVFPGKVGNSCCSHPFLNEISFTDPLADCKMHAINRLKYELDIDISSDELVLFDRMYYYANGINTHCKLIGTDIKSQDVDHSILGKTFEEDDKKIDPSEFAEHEIDYLFYCQKEVVARPRESEVSKVMFYGKGEMEGLKECEFVAPWLKMAYENIDIYNLCKTKLNKNMH